MHTYDEPKVRVGPLKHHFHGLVLPHWCEPFDDSDVYMMLHRPVLKTTFKPQPQPKQEQPKPEPKTEQPKPHTTKIPLYEPGDDILSFEEFCKLQENDKPYAPKQKPEPKPEPKVEPKPEPKQISNEDRIANLEKQVSKLLSMFGVD